MASPTTSFDNVWVKYVNSDLWFVTMMKRPVYDTSKNYYCPEVCRSDNTKISWYNKDENQFSTVMTTSDGTIYMWPHRPTIQDVIDKNLGNSIYIKFNSDNSIYIKFHDSFTWCHGSENIETKFEDDVYDAWDDGDYEPCENCRSWICECGTWSSYY